MSVAEELLDRKQTISGQRSNFDSDWQKSKELTWPFSGEFNTKRSAGEPLTRKMYEGTTANAVEKFAAAMEAFLTPRTQVWSRVRASNDDLNKIPSVKEFFENATTALLKIRNSPKARFYGQVHEIYKSLAVTGNGCMFVDENPLGGVRYRFTPVGQSWIETDFDGVVDTLYYEYELTAKAAVQKWGDEAPECARTVIKSTPQDKHKYLHVVRPNDNQDRQRADADGMRFEAYDISVEDRAQIGTKGGYQEFPYMWTRYTVNPSEVYGRGPVNLKLDDIKTLQEMEKTFMRAGHKVADPPLLIADNGKLGRGSKRVRLNHGGLNFGGLDSNGRPMIQPLHTGARLDITMEMMEQKRESIREALLNDLFDLLARDRVQMTATEVLERAKERGQLLTPVIGRQQSEFLGPMIEREVAIAQRQQLLGPLPPELVEAQGDYEIQYETDATRMQKSDEVLAFARLQEVVMPLVEGNPNLLQKFKGEEVIDHYAEDLGVPSKLINTDEEMEEIHAAQEEAAQAEQLNQTVPAAAGALKDVSAAQATAA